MCRFVAPYTPLSLIVLFKNNATEQELRVIYTFLSTKTDRKVNETRPKISITAIAVISFFPLPDEMG